MSIYVRDAGGNRQKIAGVGLPGPAGKSAYQYAVEGGFTGTEEEFRAVVGMRSNSNLLENGYFADPINQRGQTEYRTENGQVAYTIDRWIIGWSAYTKISTGGVDITSDFYQKLPPEVLAFIAGKEVTISLLTDKSLYSSTGIYDGTTSVGGGGPVVLSPYYGGSPCFAIFGEASNYETLIAAKLELGPVQTLAHKEGDTWVLNDPPPNKALELAKCQRYMRVINPSNTVGLAMNGAINVPIEMRANPTINSGVLLSLGRSAGSITTASDFLAYSRPSEPILSIVKPGTNIMDGIVAVDVGSPAPLILDANL